MATDRLINSSQGADMIAELITIATNISQINKNIDLGANKVTSMAGYTLQSDASNITTSDTLNQAVSKLEKRVEDNKNNISTLSNEKADKSTTYTKTEVNTALSGKVDKETGKGLSTNDYTTAEKTKLAGIAEGAEVNVQSNWTQTTTTADDYIKNKPTLGTVAAKNATDTYNATGTDVTTGKAVAAALATLPEPMVFKGSLGTGGTITTLPTASSSNKGYVYKVITAGTYASQSAKVGDTFISDGSAWVLIPSGDEPSGTVTNVAVANGGGLTVSGSPITLSGTITVGHSNSVTAKTSSSLKKFTYDKYGHVTGSSELSTAESNALASGIDSTKVAQIETNKNNISDIKDGTSINSFGDVEDALDDKADKSATYTKTEVDTALRAKANAADVYSKSDVETALAGKQDTISDLSTIRSGAALGATSVQPATMEAALSKKASITETTSLQNQIDEVAQSVGSGTADTEIAQARVNNKGLAYTTLNGRLSADETITDALIKGLINARYVSRGTEWIGKITPENTYNASFFTTDYYTELQGSFIKSITIYAKTTGRLRLFLLPTNVIATSTTVTGYQRIFEVNISQTGVQTVTFDVPLYCPEDKVLVYSAPNCAGYKGSVTTDDQKGWMIGQDSSTHVNLTLCVAFEYVKASDILLPFKPIGKKIGFIGDSITAGDGGTPYCKEVARQLGMSYYNYGHSGCSFTLSSGNTFKDYVSTYASDVDVFTIWGGVNDLLWFNNWSIFEQEFESFIVTMLTNYPTAKFLIITPQKFYFTGQSTRTTAWDIATSDGKKLVDYVNVEKAIASKYQIPVLDMFEIGVPVVATSQRNTFYNGNGDWLHPNTNGYKYIVNRMVRAIESL